MGDQFKPTFDEQRLFRSLRQEIAAHAAEYTPSLAWFERDHSIQSSMRRKKAKWDACDLPKPPGREPDFGPPRYTSVAMVRLCSAQRALEDVGYDLGATLRERRLTIARNVLYVAWLMTDPDARELGTVVFPWRRDYWTDPDLPGTGELDRWWARQIAFDPDGDPRGEWLALIRLSLEIVRDDREPVSMAVATVEVPEVTIPKKLRGRPRHPDTQEQRQWVALWNTHRFRTYAECARELGISAEQIAAAVHRWQMRESRKAHAPHKSESQYPVKRDEFVSRRKSAP